MLNKQHRVVERVYMGVLVKVLVTLLCPTLCNPMNCSPLCSSVNRILQARILEWIAILSSSLPDPGIKPASPALQADSSASEPPRKPLALTFTFNNHLKVHGKYMAKIRHKLHLYILLSFTFLLIFIDINSTSFLECILWFAKPINLVSQYFQTAASGCYHVKNKKLKITICPDKSLSLAGTLKIYWGPGYENWDYGCLLELPWYHGIHEVRMPMEFHSPRVVREKYAYKHFQNMANCYMALKMV